MAEATTRRNLYNVSIFTDRYNQYMADATLLQCACYGVRDIACLHNRYIINHKNYKK